MSRRAALVLAALWALAVAGSLAARPAWPIDETRYLSVGWEMWQRGDLLVPHLNGTPYSDKPPLLFWLMQAGWSVFGVNEWWPRLVPSLFALGSLFLTARLARQLWPDRKDVAAAAPFALLGCFFWSFFSTVLLFDMLLAFFALLAISGVVRASREGGPAGWSLVSLGIGLGILAKGPAILVPVVPVAFLAPWWSGGSVRPARWYPRVLASVAGGISIGLAWAIPAALAGGRDYGDAILWGQTAGRVARAFAHRRPWGWYLPFLPVLAFPWILWPSLWRGLRQAKALSRDPGVRLCAAWAGTGLLLFSAISGKQVYYLLPLAPAVALLTMRVGTSVPIAPRRVETLWIAGALLFLALLLAVVPLVSDRLPLPPWASRLSPAGALLSAASGLGLAWRPASSRSRLVERIAMCAVVAVVAIQWSIARAAAGTYDVEDIGRHLNRLQREGHPLSHVGRYSGEYQFAGRLDCSIDVIDSNAVSRWFARHPDGYVIAYTRRSLTSEKDVDFSRVFRGGVVTVRRLPGAASEAGFRNRSGGHEAGG